MKLARKWPSKADARVPGVGNDGYLAFILRKGEIERLRKEFVMRSKLRVALRLRKMSIGIKETPVFSLNSYVNDLFVKSSWVVAVRR